MPIINDKVRCSIRDDAADPAATVQVLALWSLALCIELCEKLWPGIREADDGANVIGPDGSH